jgi:hypothetical protein
MSTMSLQILVSFLILGAIGLCNIANHRRGQTSIPFSYFWLALLTCLFVVLSVGLVQVHFDCMSLWGECYARNYPNWIFMYKPILLLSPSIWSAAAIGYLVLNVLRLVRGGLPSQN